MDVVSRLIGAVDQLKSVTAQYFRKFIGKFNTDTLARVGSYDKRLRRLSAS